MIYLGFTNGTKWDLNSARDYFKKEGYTLVSQEYKNKREKMTVICPKGHHIEISLDTFTKGTRCGECYRNAKRRTPRNSFENIKKIFKDRGYKLTSKTYVTGQYLEYICDKGHSGKTLLPNFKSGRGCSLCGREKARESIINNGFTLEDKKLYANSRGYELIEDRFFLSNDKVTLKCPRGHKWRAIWGNFSKGRDCPQCSEEDRLNRHYKIIESNGYQILDTNGYRGGHTKITLKCQNGHIWRPTWGSFSKGNRCCHCQRSLGEEKVATVLDKYSVTYTPQFRFLKCCDKGTLPFDFYLDDLNVCIEYDGKQHYVPVGFGKKKNEDLEQIFDDRKKKDSIKDVFCENNGIKLIRIPYWEYDNIENILIKELELTL